MANRVSAPLPGSIVRFWDYCVARGRFTATR